MSKAVNSTNSIESVSYELDPRWMGKTVYSVIDPNGNSIGDSFESFRSMLNEMLQGDIGPAMMKEYMENLEGKFSDEEFENYAWDNLERVMEEMGYRVLRTTVSKE